MRLPQAFEEKMQGLLKEEYGAYTECLDKSRYYGLRVNTRKISAEDFERLCPFGLQPVPWIKNGFYYDGETVPASRYPYYFAGLYYLQEPSAMTPADRLPIEPGDRVLDVCAAPGGKATELGVRLGGRGILVANDVSSSRAKGLLKNLEVFGIPNITVLSEEPGKLTGYFPEYFDKILLDAPCSGEGMFRKDRKMVRAWEERGPEYFCRVQRGLILQAADMLKPGGLLLYSTCTFDGRENEEVIAYLLEQCPEFCLEEIRHYEGFAEGMPELTKSGDLQLRKAVRIFPHRMRGEGHFLALLRKGNIHHKDGQGVDIFGEGKYRSRKGFPRKEKDMPETLGRFLEDVEKEIDLSSLDIRADRAYLIPEGFPDMRGLRALRTGLLLGELKKGRFEPSQAFAMSLKKEEYRKVLDFPASDARVVKYLKGETLEVPDLIPQKAEGWHLVCVDGYPLGWGKLGGGMLKNKYLPGWRLL